jgi:hypothetical protein
VIRGRPLLDCYDRSLQVLARWALENMLFMPRLFWLDPRKDHCCPAFRAGRTQTSIGLRRGRLKMCHRTPPGSKRLSRMGCPFIVYRKRTCAARSCKPTTDIPLRVRVYGHQNTPVKWREGTSTCRSFVTISSGLSRQRRHPKPKLNQRQFRFPAASPRTAA